MVFSGKKKKFLIIILGVLFIIIMLGVIRHCIKAQYQLISPKVGSIVEAVYSLGNVKSEIEYNLKIGITDAVSSLFVAEGDTVAKGSRLIKTDTGIVFRSPISGIVSKVYFFENEMIVPGKNILTVVNLEKRYIEVLLDQEAILHIKKNQNAEISFENLRNKKFIGRVGSLYPSDGDFKVKIIVKDLSDNIFPGMTCDVAIMISKKNNALMIPSSVLQNNRVRIIRNNRRKWVQVTTGKINDNWIEVTNETILPTDKIIVKKDEF